MPTVSLKLRGRSCSWSPTAGSGIAKTVAFNSVSPLLGFVLGSLMLVAVAPIFPRATPSKVDR